ncbi:hypothetical protein FEP08_03213 [Burkholderia multivorans]|nr:hypothetical protein [Burkholderia multivorans]
MMRSIQTLLPERKLRAITTRMVQRYQNLAKAAQYFRRLAQYLSLFPKGRTKTRLEMVSARTNIELLGRHSIRFGLW